MAYAINVGDLTKDTILGMVLVAPVIPGRILVHAEPGRVDGGAVLLECEEKQALGIIGIIRMKFAKNLLRCYAAKSATAKTWKRV